MKQRPIIFGADSAGKDLKNSIIKALKDEKGFSNWELIDLEASSWEYPEVADNVAYKVVKENGLGILICRSGLGTCIAANKVPAIRAVTCHETCSASMARSYLDANVLCLGAGVIGLDLTLSIVSSFLLTPFEGGKYLEKVNMIREIENRFCQG